MIRNIHLFVVFLWCLNSFHAQDLLSGIGSFDNVSPLNSWITTTNGSGNFEAITSESYFGTTSLKTEITASNADDVTLTNSTNFSLNSGLIYTASFYLKGTVNNEFSISLMNNATEIVSKVGNTVLDEWTYFTFSFTSNITSSTGKIKINFKEKGVYFIDEFVLKNGNVNKWYVSVNGSNSNPGNNINSPFKTINHAIDNAWNPGDIIYVMNGTYRNNGFGNGNKNNGPIVNINKAGTLNGPLVIKNYPNHKPKLEFDGSGGFVCGTGKFLEIAGFEIQGPNQQITYNEANSYRLIQNNYYKGRGITVWASSGGHHIILHSNKVYDCPGSGIRINNSDYATITNNEVSNCTIYTSSGSSAIVLAQSKSIDSGAKVKMRITKNKVFNNENKIHYFNHNYDCSSNSSAYGCQDYPKIIDGSGCYITRNNDRGSGGNDENPNGQYQGYFYFANNIAYGNGINGLVVHKSDYAIVVNNTIYNNGATPLTEGRQAAGGITVNNSKEVRMYNNISWVRYTTDYCYRVFGATQNIKGKNNILFNGNSNAGGLTSMIEANPEFTDVNNLDFNLSAASPARDSGISESNILRLPGDLTGYLYTPAYDFANYSRNLNTTDVGALEYVSPLSVNEFKGFENQITLYPNPASNILTIKGVESANSISIFDVLGKEQIRIKNTETNLHFNKIDIHQLKPGLYILKVFGAKTQNSLKFIKS